SNMLQTVGLSLDAFAKAKIGPILFREELVYYREVRLDEIIHVDVELTKLNTSNARFSFRHIVYKADGTKSAVVSVDEIGRASCRDRVWLSVYALACKEEQAVA